MKKRKNTNEYTDDEKGTLATFFSISLGKNDPYMQQLETERKEAADFKRLLQAAGIISKDAK